MASPTQWTLVWASTRSWWRTGNWHTAVHGVAESWLSDWTEMSLFYLNTFKIHIYNAYRICKFPPTLRFPQWETFKSYVSFHLFKYLPRVCSVPGTIPAAKDRAMNETKPLPLQSFHSVRNLLVSRIYYVFGCHIHKYKCIYNWKYPTNYWCTSSLCSSLKHSELILL